MGLILIGSSYDIYKRCPLRVVSKSCILTAYYGARKPACSVLYHYRTQVGFPDFPSGELFSSSQNGACMHINIYTTHTQKHIQKKKVN